MSATHHNNFSFLFSPDGHPLPLSEPSFIRPFLAVTGVEGKWTLSLLKEDDCCPYFQSCHVFLPAAAAVTAST